MARFQQAIAFRPDYAEAYNNLGAVLWKQPSPARRRHASSKRSLCGRTMPSAQQPGQGTAGPGQARPGRGTFSASARSRAGLPRRAIEPGHLLFGSTAITSAAGPPTNRGCACPGVLPQPSLPRWKGQPLAGRRLLLVAEQGLGDTLHFVRLRPAAEAAGRSRGAGRSSRRWAGCWRLIPISDELFLLGSADELPRGDFYLPLLSCPGVLGTDAVDHSQRCSLPLGRSRVDRPVARGAVAESKASRSASPGKARAISPGSLAFDSVGPVCAAGRLARRAADQPAKRIWIGADQPRSIFRCWTFRDRLDEAAGPFMDTAAVIRNLDLVVTSDTAIAHLAGALGAPVWVALHSRPIGAGCSIATTLPGIRPCDCSANRRSASGRTFSSGLQRPFRCFARNRQHAAFAGRSFAGSGLQRDSSAIDSKTAERNGPFHEIATFPRLRIVTLSDCHANHHRYGWHAFAGYGGLGWPGSG